jgi:hypothetical protein
MPRVRATGSQAPRADALEGETKAEQQAQERAEEVRRGEFVKPAVFVRARH